MAMTCSRPCGVRVGGRVPAGFVPGRRNARHPRSRAESCARGTEPALRRDQDCREDPGAADRDVASAPVGRGSAGYQVLDQGVRVGDPARRDLDRSRAASPWLRRHPVRRPRLLCLPAMGPPSLAVSSAARPGLVVARSPRG